MSTPARRGDARSRGAAGRAAPGSTPTAVLEVREAERDVPGLVLQREVRDLRGSPGRGRGVSRNDKQVEEACPRRARRAGTTRARSRARRAASAATPARPSSTPRAGHRGARARRVKTSTWRASSATCTASSCTTSRKCGCTRPTKPRRHDQGRLLVLDEVRHHLHDRGLDLGAEASIGGVPGDLGRGIPLAGRRPARTAAARCRPTTTPSVVEVEAQRRSARPRRARRAPRAPTLGSAPVDDAAGAGPPARAAPSQRSSIAAAPLDHDVVGRRSTPVAPRRGTTPRGATLSAGSRPVDLEAARRRGSGAERPLEEEVRAPSIETRGRLKVDSRRRQ